MSVNPSRKNAPPDPQVFSVGRDKDLLVHRRATLEGSGITTYSLRPEQAEELVHDPLTRVWVFCGSIETGMLVYLACAIRRHSPQSRLLLIEYREPVGNVSSLFHEVITTEEDPESLAEAIQHLLQTT